MPAPEPAPAPTDPRAASRRRKKLRAGRKEAALRRERILERLVEGGSYLAIASEENCSVQWVRRIVAEALSARDIDPPAHFARLQIARLNHALSIANVHMLEGRLAAVDRYLKIVEQLDRYHGLKNAVRAADAAPPRALAAPAPRALPAPSAAPALNVAQDSHEMARN
jgi:hypothetical protein